MSGRNGRCGAGAEPSAGADLAEEVEGDRLVLELLGRVPAPEAQHLRMQRARDRRLVEDQVRGGGGQVLEEDRDAELHLPGQPALHPGHRPVRARDLARDVDAEARE